MGGDDVPSFKDIEALKASELDRRIRMLKGTNTVLNRNFEELVDAEEYYQDTPDLWRQKNKQYLRDFQIEYLRRLHNYISAYYSLYEHTQNFTNELENDSLDRAYDRKLDELGIEETSKFLLRFRAYTQHYQLPPIQARFELTDKHPTKAKGTEVRRICFSREELLEWDSWNAAEDYVRDLDENIDILPLLERITEKVNEFHEWFVRAVRDHHTEEYEIQREMHREVVENLKERWDS